MIKKSIEQLLAHSLSVEASEPQVLKLLRIDSNLASEPQVLKLHVIIKVFELKFDIAYCKCHYEMTKFHKRHHKYCTA
jgi:hypothetical protein